MPDDTFHPYTLLEPARHPDADAVRRWQADIAAGRIATPRLAAATLATLDANDRLFRDRARRARLEARA